MQAANLPAVINRGGQICSRPEWVTVENLEAGEDGVGISVGGALPSSGLPP